MNTIRNSVFAGFFAGLVFALLNFVEDGKPGRTLTDVARWFGLNSGNELASKFTGFLLLVILGIVFGLLFGLIQRYRAVTLGRALATGLALGAAFWFVFVFILGNLTRHAPLFQLDFGGFLVFFVPCLVFGLILGSVYFQSTVGRQS